MRAQGAAGDRKAAFERFRERRSQRPPQRPSAASRPGPSSRRPGAPPRPDMSSASRDVQEELARERTQRTDMPRQPIDERRGQIQPIRQDQGMLHLKSRMTADPTAGGQIQRFGDIAQVPRVLPRPPLGNNQLIGGRPPLGGEQTTGQNTPAMQAFRAQQQAQSRADLEARGLRQAQMMAERQAQAAPQPGQVRPPGLVDQALRRPGAPLNQGLAQPVPRPGMDMRGGGTAIDQPRQPIDERRGQTQPIRQDQDPRERQRIEDERRRRLLMEQQRQRGQAGGLPFQRLQNFRPAQAGRGMTQERR